jgi:hypothetical protein
MALLLVLAFVPGVAFPADDPSGMSASEMAKESSNPLGRLWILKNTFDNTLQDGDATSKDRWKHTWTFQPTIPMPLPGGYIAVIRITFPTVLRTETPKGPGSVGPPGPGSPPRPPPGVSTALVDWDDESGFGDLGVFSLFGRNVEGVEGLGQRGAFVWGVGPTFTFPTSSEDSLGSEKLSLGPAGVLAYMGDRYILAGLSQNWFSVANRDGGSDRSDVEFSWLQVIYQWNLPKGWQVGGKPVITADWDASSDDRWNVPIGLGVWKALRLGKMPLKIGAEVQYSVVHQDTLGQRWNFAITIDPVIPPLVKWPWQD